VDFFAATNLDTAAIAQVQAQVRQRILRAFVRRGLIGKRDRDEMRSWEHGGGFSLDASVCTEGNDRAGLERLLRYCARPPFALEHLHTLDAGHLLYHNPKPRSDSPRDLVLTPLELIDKIAALIPPPLLRCAGTQFADACGGHSLNADAGDRAAAGGSQRNKRTTPPCRIPLPMGDAAGTYL